MFDLSKFNELLEEYKTYDFAFLSLLMSAMYKDFRPINEPAHVLRAIRKCTDNLPDCVLSDGTKEFLKEHKKTLDAMSEDMQNTIIILKEFLVGIAILQDKKED